MKSKIWSLLLAAGLLVLVVSCGKDDDDGGVGGSQSTIGETGNTFSAGSVSGTSGISAEVTNLADGVSTVTCSATVSNQTYLDMLDAMSDVSVAGNSAQRQSKYRITTKGIESVYPEGNLTLVKYDAKVGDVYSLQRGSTTMKREVTEVSAEDDFFWGGMMIKTIEVKETGRNIPGVSYILFRFNHKFGLVNTRVYFEDGSSAGSLVYSDNSN